MTDDEVIAAITQVKGIGRWSAEMFLMFRLRRPDVLPVGDLGIVNAVKNVYGLRKKPTPDRIRKIGEAWRPYRSVASLVPVAEPRQRARENPAQRTEPIASLRLSSAHSPHRSDAQQPPTRKKWDVTADLGPTPRSRSTRPKARG